MPSRTNYSEFIIDIYKSLQRAAVMSIIIVSVCETKMILASA